MTLLEALQAASRDAQTESSRNQFDPEAAQRFEAAVIAQHQALLLSGVMDDMVASAMAETPFRLDALISAAIRFGMRAQRKLDHPELATSIDGYQEKGNVS